MKNTYQIYLISDSTGETIDRIFTALKSQFKNFRYEIHHFAFTRTNNQINEIIKITKKEKSRRKRPDSAPTALGRAPASESALQGVQHSVGGMDGLARHAQHSNRAQSLTTNSMRCFSTVPFTVFASSTSSCFGRFEAPRAQRCDPTPTDALCASRDDPSPPLPTPSRYQRGHLKGGEGGRGAEQQGAAGERHHSSYPPLSAPQELPPPVDFVTLARTRMRSLRGGGPPLTSRRLPSLPSPSPALTLPGWPLLYTTPRALGDSSRLLRGIRLTPSCPALPPSA